MSKNTKALEVIASVGIVGIFLLWFKQYNSSEEIAKRLAEKMIENEARYYNYKK